MKLKARTCTARCAAVQPCTTIMIVVVLGCSRRNGVGRAIATVTNDPNIKHRRRFPEETADGETAARGAGLRRGQGDATW